ncbi:MAG: YfcE family phosphodiesterase [Planctomycetaceae bacterium]|nr:YfcE family phosphodiesterase [Planctomycetaceae bacterium]
MRLGVVSDSHGHVDNTRAAVERLKSLAVDHVLHCGDVGTAEVVQLFSPWPTGFVFGNCDYDRAGLAAAIEAAGQTCYGEFGALQLADKRIAILHSDDRRRFEAAIAGGRFDLVCYGHTHEAALQQHGGTLTLNPGALYRANPHTLAVVDLPELEVDFVSL